MQISTWGHGVRAGTPGAGKQRPCLHALPVTVSDGQVVPSTAHVRAQTPLVDALMERATRPDVSMHVPGHKKGHNVHPQWSKLLRAGVLRHDLTELPGLDYLTSPTGPILLAQQLAAHTFHADRTWFLVNGSSVGIHAAIMAVAGPGDTLVVGRNCHQSAFSGMTLSGCKPWWVQPEVDHALGLAHGVSVATLGEALQAAKVAGKRVTGVLVVSPTYWGTCCDISGLSKVCSAAGVPLVVDEAHGAHFGVHPQLPPSAMQLGADLAIQSTHKVLSSMTQSSMLHMRGQRVNAARISRALQMLQSSSPSYVLLASLDAARAHAEDPEACLGEAIRAAQIARAGLEGLPGVCLLSSHGTHLGSTSNGTLEGSPGVRVLSSHGTHLGSTSNGTLDGTAHDGGRLMGQQAEGPPATHDALALLNDPLRLTVAVEGLGMSGYQAADLLDSRHNVAVELANHKVVVCAMGPGTTEQDAHALVSAFKQLSADALPVAAAARAPHSTSVHPGVGQTAGLPRPLMRLTPRDAFFAPSERVTVASAVGRVSAELLCPYPPGVPVLYPGEVITEAAISILQATLAAGGTVTGAADSSLQTVLVVQQ